MNKAEALEQLRDMVAAATEPVLTDADLERLLVYAAVPDANGREPEHPDWTPTYDQWGLRAAAAEGWMRKAARASTLTDVTADGASVKRSQIADHARSMAASYGRASGAGRIGTTGPMAGLGGAGRTGSGAGDLPVGNAAEVDDDPGGAAGTWPGYGGRA